MTDRMEALTKAMWNIDESLIQEGLDADEQLEETVALKPSPIKRTRHNKLTKKVLLWVAALILVLILGGTTIYAIQHFQGEIKKTQDTIGFSLDSENYKIDENLIKGQILEAKDITKKQYEQQTIYDGIYMGYYSKVFTKAEEAKAYVGYEKLTIPRLTEQKESSAKVMTFVSEAQKFESVTVSILYTPIEGVYITENAEFWTKDCTEEPGVGLIGERINDDAKTEYRPTNGREFLVVTLKNPSTTDYVNSTAYWAEDTVLYGLSLRYTDSEEHKAEAEKIMLQWMNSF